jgi:hypothetical protein
VRQLQPIEGEQSLTRLGTERCYPLSPKSRQVTDLEGKITRLEAYEERRDVTPLDFGQIIEPDLWERHRQNSQRVLQEMNEVQDLAVEIKVAVRTQRRT